MNQDVQFFYEHCGVSYDPKTETPEEGRLKCAYSLSEAERYAHNEGLLFEWDYDPEENSGSFRDDCEPYALWYCICYYDEDNPLESLWGIDLGEGGHPDSHPHARLVQAELALEIMKLESLSD